MAMKELEVISEILDFLKEEIEKASQQEVGKYIEGRVDLAIDATAFIMEKLIVLIKENRTDG